MYGLPRMRIFGHKLDNSPMNFMTEKVTGENHNIKAHNFNNVDP